MESFDAFYLPGLSLPADQPFRELTFGQGEGRVVARAPVLSPQQIRDLAEGLREARARRLARLPVYEIANRISRAINRWLDPYSPFLRDCERLLPAITGYPPVAIRKALPGFLAGYREENLRRLLLDELGDPAVLDEFRPRRASSGLARAFGPELVAHVFAGNVPGLPAQSLICALLVKAASIGKSASEEPLFPVLFAQSLAEADPELAACVAVNWWRGGDEPLESALFAEAGAVVAYGSESAIESIRSRVPSSARFIPYSHKLSFGLIGREVLTTNRLVDIAAAAAYDTAKHDQQGCLSPHLFYVERGGEVDPRAFAEQLGSALEQLEGLVPRGRITPPEAAAAATMRRAHEFRSATGNARLFASPEGRWAVLFDDDPSFSASCLNRTVHVRAIDSLESVVSYLDPVRHYLQTAGLAVDEERSLALATALGEIGLDRVCPLGQMADPPPTWHHDGRPNLLDLLRWTDLEPPNTGGRWEFTHPAQGIFGRPDHATALEQPELVGPESVPQLRQAAMARVDVEE